MNPNKEYFNFIDKLENDPEFCFMISDAGQRYQDQAVRDRAYQEQSKFMKRLWRNADKLWARTQEVRRTFSIHSIHPSYEQCLKTIAKDPKWALAYAYFNQRSRFVAAEQGIAEDSFLSCHYALEILEGRFELGEPAISKDAGDAVWYAENVLKDRFYAAEDAISSCASSSLLYAKRWGRFELGERVMSKNAKVAYDYAENVLRGRFELGEDAMMESSEIMFKYATTVIKGKLPEKMHQAMLLKSYEDEAA